MLQKEHSGKWHEHPNFPTFGFFDIQGQERMDSVNFSFFNEREINAIVYLVSLLSNNYSNKT